MEEERARREGERDVEDERWAKAMRDPADMQTREEDTLERMDASRHEAVKRMDVELPQRSSSVSRQNRNNTIRCSLWTHNPLSHWEKFGSKTRPYPSREAPATLATSWVQEIRGNRTRQATTRKMLREAPAGLGQNKRETAWRVCRSLRLVANIWRFVVGHPKGHLDHLVSSVVKDGGKTVVSRMLRARISEEKIKKQSKFYL